MAENKESFVFYKSFYEALQDLKDKDRLKVYDAICEMALNGNENKLTGIAKTIFTLIKPQVLANSRRYENGKKGGRPKKETTGFENEKTIGYEKEKTTGFENIETKTKPNVNENENVNVNENVNDNANVNVEVMKITKCYEENIGMLTPATAEVLFAYLDDLTADMIVKAIKIANNNNKKSTNYIDGILKDWVRKGYKTLADTQKEQQERNRAVVETDEERKARILKEMEEYQKNDNARVY